MEKGVLRAAAGPALLLLLASSVTASLRQPGYIGCLFSDGLCDPDTEYCFDDGAFGRCLEVFASEAAVPNMRDLEVEELAALENEMSSLLSEGYGWADAKTQCVMEALLDAIYTGGEYSKVQCNELNAVRDEDFENEPHINEDLKEDDVAYIRYTPNDDAKSGRMAEFANELYDPPPTDIYGEVREEDNDADDMQVERRSDVAPSLFSQLYNTPDGFRTGFESKDNNRGEGPTDSEVRALEALIRPPQPSLLFGDGDEEEEEDEGFGEGWWSERPISPPYLVMRRSAPAPPPPDSTDLSLELDDLELPDDSDNLFRVAGPQTLRRTHPIFHPRQSEHDDNILHIQDLFNGDKRSVMEAAYRDDNEMFNEEPDEADVRELSHLLHQLDEWSFQRSERLDVKKPGPHFSTNNYINQDSSSKTPASTTESVHNIRIEGQKETVPNELPNRPTSKDHSESKKTILYEEPEKFYFSRSSYVTVEVAERMRKWHEGALLLNAIGQHLHAPTDVLGHLYVEPFSITFMVLEPNRLHLNATIVGKKIESFRKKIYDEFGFNITAIAINDSENVGIFNEQEERMKKSANKLTQHHEGDDHYDVVDTTYTYIKFKDKIHKWNDGSKILHAVEKYLSAPQGMFTNLRVDQHEITFKVIEPNSLGLNATMVAHAIDNFKDRLRDDEGVIVTSIGVGDKTKLPSVVKLSNDDYEVYVVLVIVVGVLAALALSAGVLYLTRTNNTKLANLSQSDTEPSKHYQDLCRARMSSKNEVAPAQRVTSLSRESENGSPSSRSSTSSWSEEPALSNMNVTTGQMVLSNMEEHLKNKERLDTEWTALCSYEPDPSSTEEANVEENKAKNRYPTALPFDHARVLLNHLSNITGSSYINASTISDHDPRNPAYILTQGPLPATAPDFWQMVWEQGCVVIVMLTRLIESDTALCHRYWPAEGSELYHIFEVHLVSEHIWCDDYLVRSFYLKNMKTGETRTVTQFHFLSWPESTVPHHTKPLLEFRRKVNKSFRGRSCPIVVHCNDGLGRSGTYCLLDMVLNRMAKGAKEIDIAATLEHVRDQRAGCVKTKQQFEFVISAVADEVQAILRVHPNNQ